MRYCYPCLDSDGTGNRMASGTLPSPYHVLDVWDIFARLVTAVLERVGLWFTLGPSGWKLMGHTTLMVD